MKIWEIEENMSIFSYRLSFFYVRLCNDKQMFFFASFIYLFC